MLNDNYKANKYSPLSTGEGVGGEVTSNKSGSIFLDNYRDGKGVRGEVTSNKSGSVFLDNYRDGEGVGGEVNPDSLSAAEDARSNIRSYIKIGIAGPVGSGKTALIERLTRAMCKDYSIAVITNDIYTKEDAEFLTKNSLLPASHIIGVETGGCPHTAIREDASMNLEAIEEMVKRIPGVQIIFIESGGDNLSATFSPDLADVTIFVIDVAGGDKIPRKGGPGVMRSDLLVINKIDLAPYVKADLDVMHNDAGKMRNGNSFVFTDLIDGCGLDCVIGWIKKFALLEEIDEPELCR